VLEAIDNVPEEDRSVQLVLLDRPPVHSHLLNVPFFEGVEEASDLRLDLVDVVLLFYLDARSL